MRSREILARNLRALRKQQGLSQEALAGQAELDRTYISGIERRKYSVGIDRLDRLSEILGVSSSDLLAPSGKIRR